MTELRGMNSKTHNLQVHKSFLKSLQPLRNEMIEIKEDIKLILNDKNLKVKVNKEHKIEIDELQIKFRDLNDNYSLTK